MGRILQSRVHSEYGYFLSLLSPADVATMIALAAVMLIFRGDHEATMRDGYAVMASVIIPIAMWMAFSKGIGAPPFVRYVVLYVICGVVLFVRHSFGGLGSAVGAAVLVVANVGITQLMK
jgi:hypothetical protein